MKRSIGLINSDLINSVDFILPDEIWEDIFLIDADSMNTLEEKQKELSKLACVSHDWSKKIRELARNIFRNIDSEMMTNWILRQMSDIEELVCNSTIMNETIMTLTNLKNLNILSNPHITNKGICHLSSSLHSLTAGLHSPVTHVGLQKLTNLTDLKVRGSRFNNASIKKLVKLRKLCLNEVKSTITFKGISKLSELRTLEVLGSTSIYDQDLRQMTNLTSFTFHGFIPPFSNYDISTLSNLTSLSVDHRIDNEGIQNFPKLTKLNIYAAHLIDDDGIKKLTSLTHLVLNEFITDEGVKNLINLKALIYPRFANFKSEVGDDGVKNLTNLVYLDIDTEKFTDEAIKKLTRLEKFYNFDNSQISENALNLLPNLVDIRPKHVVPFAKICHL